MQLPKLRLNKETFLLVVIFAMAAFVRFYNFEARVVYGPEQAISLISAAENLQKPSLLGIPYLLRQTSTGLNLFTSPIFGYTLVPLILLFNFDVIKITVIFALINILTGLILYFIIRRMLDKTAAFISTILFLFSNYMIYHSLFIWTSNYMPLIGVITIYLLYKFVKTGKQAFFAFLLGLITGIGFGIQYFYIVGALIVLGLIIKYSQKKFFNTLFFLAGALAGELPTLIFDLKHNFYNTKTLFAYFWEILTHPGQSQISYYHFLAFWAAAVFFLAIFLTKLYKKYRIATILLLFSYVFLNLISPVSSFKRSYGMPVNLTVNDILKSAAIIYNDSPKDFNVSVLTAFDNRGYVLRYPLQYIYKKQPLGVEDYPKSGTIYVLAEKNFDFAKPGIWEVSSFMPYKTKTLGSER